MSLPISRAKTLTLPDAQQYPPSELNLYPTFTRDKYRAAYGIDPPTLDGSKPIKDWSATEWKDSRDIVEFKYYTLESGIVVQKKIQMTGIEAAQVNLPGIHHYEPYVVAPTMATRGGTPIDPHTLLDVTLANQLAWWVGAPDTVEVEGGGEEGQILGGIYYPPDETRRVCTIRFGTNKINAGLKWAERNRMGVDSPGHWDIAMQSEPRWVTEVPVNVTPSALPPIPVPQRDLDPSEKINVTPFGWVIYRGDLQGGSTVGSSGDGFNSEDRAKLVEVHAILTAQSGNPQFAKTPFGIVGVSTKK